MNSKPKHILRLSAFLFRVPVGLLFIFRFELPQVGTVDSSSTWRTTALTVSRWNVFFCAVASVHWKTRHTLYSVSNESINNKKKCEITSNPIVSIKITGTMVKGSQRFEQSFSNYFFFLFQPCGWSIRFDLIASEKTKNLQITSDLKTRFYFHWLFCSFECFVSVVKASIVLCSHYVKKNY